MIKFKIKTPQKYIEILKIIGIDKYTLDLEDWKMAVFILLFLFNISFLLVFYLEIVGFNHGASMFSSILSLIVEIYILNKLLEKYNKKEKKVLSKKFYKLFNVNKKNSENTINFIKENIYFIDKLDLSNDKLIQLVKNYKVYEKDIIEIKNKNIEMKKKIEELGEKNQSELKIFSDNIIESKKKVY